MKTQECCYCWRQFESYLYKCPYCGKLVKEEKKKESFFKKFRRKWNKK